jgi:predicted transcriptional regulator
MNSERAIQLLGQGHSPRIVAAAMGVTESAISQLLSQDSNAQLVSEKRAAALSRYSDIDDKWNRLEDTLLDKLEKVIPLLIRPRDIINALDKVNSAKRRGSFAPQESLPQDRVVSLELPPLTQYNFITNINQQIVEIEASDGNRHNLVTIPTNQLDGLANEKRAKSLTFGGSSKGAEIESPNTEALLGEQTENLADLL